MSAVRDAAQAARDRPALALYLAALAALGFKWLSPISSLYERAGWSDLLVAGAAAAWLWELARARRLPALRAFHLALALFVLAGVASMAFAEARGTGARTVLLMTELAVLAVLTSEFASDRRGRDAIVLVVAALALVTAALGAAGLALFYAGVDTSLTGDYGELVPSDRYARVTAGFHSPPLLGSFCIVASAVVGGEDSPLPRRLRLVTQVALALLVLATLSRAIIGFAAAAGIRAIYARRGAVTARRAAVAAVLASVALMAILTVGHLDLDPTRPSTTFYSVSDPSPARRASIEKGVDTLADHPLVGKGPGSLVGENNHGDPFRAHLTPLNVAATMGIPALAAVAFLVVVLWRERRRPTRIATWSGLAGLAVDGLAQDIEHFRHVWVLVGFADAERRRGDHSTG